MRRNVTGRFAPSTSTWRKLASATWKAANDPTIYGMLTVDATAANRFLEGFAGSPTHVTMTHLVIKAIANTLALHPDCNGFIRRGRVYLRDRVDVFVLVAVAPHGDDEEVDLSGVKVEDADRKTVLQIAAETASHVAEIRAGRDAALASTKRMLARLPPFVAKPAMRMVTFAQYELNWDLSFLGIPRDPFGGAFVTSVGPLGLGFAFPPIVPFTRLAVNIAAGAVRDEPVVAGERIVARPVLPITATFDHRMIDGYQASRLAQTFKEIMEDPAARFG